MSRGEIILGILLFAVVTAVLYVWGLRKSLSQQEDLTRMLLGKCGRRVLRYLKKHGTITLREIAAEIRGVKVGQAWSRKRLTVVEPEQFAENVAQYLLEQQYIQPAPGKGYRLKK
ncbi:MAG TPA: hypothetical protein IAA32_08075 [Candidatus Butyricicoccus stercorigallinarum]|nr:hypothetical protein [Candidatus Butyricicoccus stercorigallinarum]